MATQRRRQIRLPRVPSAARDAGVGLACLGQAIGILARRPRLWLLGALPVLLTSTLLLGAVVGLAYASPGIATWLTPFAAGWGGMLSQIVRTLLAAMLVVAGVVLAVLLLGTLTLALGSPFYERISAAVDRELGEPAAVAPERLAAQARRAVGDVAGGLRLSLLAGGATLLIGLVPALGQLAAPVVGALAGSWLLTLELMGPAAERRGLGALAARRALLRPHRPACLGLGLPAYLAMLVPLLGVVVFPVAVAGGTILVRTLEDDPARA